MGCSGFKRIFQWRRKQTITPLDPSQPPYGTRPAHKTHGSITSDASDLADIEKAYIRGRSSDDKETCVDGGRGGRRCPVSPIPKSAANYRPNVHPKFSAYSGVASRADGRDDSSYSYAARQRGGGEVSDTWTGSQSSTQVSARQSDQKIKDEGGVDDPEQEARRKKAEAIRRKFEEEEQERLDFFQMM